MYISLDVNVETVAELLIAVIVELAEPVEFTELAEVATVSELNPWVAVN